ncbi:MAG TPA: nucleotide exchange factor GrpE [Xanthobacteraceae bacterium]
MTDNSSVPGTAAGAEARDNPATTDEAAASPGAPADASARGETIDPADHARVAAEYKDKLLRVLAEMENLRRRTTREIADTRAYGISGFARDILAVADNMERALQALDAELREKAEAGVKALLDGVELTERELHKVLEKHGVKKFEPIGEKFDPNLHQAMFEVPDPSVPAGTIAQVVQPGYMIGERMLRPALVGVAKGGPKAVAEPPANDNVGEPARDPQPSS